MTTQATNHLTATTGAGTVGQILPGQFSGTFCFVPLTCLGKTGVDQNTYLKTGWATRNLRLNAGRCIGSHLFPWETTKVDPQDPKLAAFVAALAHEQA
jgi:hypothetical protein